jgi:molybdate transport system substrate-binding protein
MFHSYRAIALAMAVFVSSPVHAETTLVAVAANFAGAADAIAAAFAAETEHQAQVTTGSTGKLYAQISEGAPFEVLLSADTKTPEKLVAEGQAVAQSRATYAIGGLTLWSVDSGLIGADPTLAILSDKIRFLAIANPDLAPYGVAAKEVLTKLALWEEVQQKIVLGQNIGQVFAMASAGAADAAFVARSALDDPKAGFTGSRWDVPQDLFTPLRQDAVLLKKGKDNPAAIAFLKFLQSDEAQAIIKSFGYTLPK